MRKAVATILATACAATFALTLAPAAAAGPQACAKEWIETGYQGPGQVIRKAAGTTCRDLNLIYTDDHSPNAWDRYAGFYLKNGVWVIGAAGYTPPLKNGPQNRVLLTAVLPGTRMGVGSYHDAPDGVQVMH